MTFDDQRNSLQYGKRATDVTPADTTAGTSDSFEARLGALISARIAPLRSALQDFAHVLEGLRRALPAQLVPLKEAARRMGVSEKTARRRVSAGEWPARRDGRRVLVDLSELRPMTDEDVARAARAARDGTGGTDGPT